MRLITEKTTRAIQNNFHEKLRKHIAKYDGRISAIAYTTGTMNGYIDSSVNMQQESMEHKNQEDSKCNYVTLSNSKEDAQKILNDRRDIIKVARNKKNPITFDLGFIFENFTIPTIKKGYTAVSKFRLEQSFYLKKNLEIYLAQIKNDPLPLISKIAIVTYQLSRVIITESMQNTLDKYLKDFESDKKLSKKSHRKAYELKNILDINYEKLITFMFIYYREFEYDVPLLASYLCENQKEFKKALKSKFELWHEFMLKAVFCSRDQVVEKVKKIARGQVELKRFIFEKFHRADGQTMNLIDKLGRVGYINSVDFEFANFTPLQIKEIVKFANQSKDLNVTKKTIDDEIEYTISLVYTN